MKLYFGLKKKKKSTARAKPKKKKNPPLESNATFGQ